MPDAPSYDGPGRPGPELDQFREARFLRRKTRHDRDPYMDPRRRRLYHDRTLLDTRGIAEVMDIGENRVSVLRYGTAVRAVRRYGRPYRRPHPAMIPPTVAYLPAANGLTPAVEKGDLLEWLEQRGTHILDLETGGLSKAEWSTYGRTRSKMPKAAREWAARKTG